MLKEVSEIKKSKGGTAFTFDSSEEEEEKEEVEEEEAEEEASGKLK